MNILLSRKVREKTNNETIPSFFAILKSILKISLPAALETFLISLIGLIDTMMVGGRGTEALAAVSLCQQPVFITMAVSFGLNAGITAIISRRRGENNQVDAKTTMKNAIIASVIVGGAITLLSILLARPFLRVTGAKDDTIDLAITYFRIVSSILIFNYIRVGICAGLRAEGSTKITLVTNIVANVVNVFLNYCLINGNLGFPALGVTGAAIATVIGNMVAFVIAILVLRYRHGFLHLDSHEEWKIDKVNINNLIRVSMPAFIEQMFMRVGFYIIAVIVNNLGTKIVAQNAIISGVISLAFSITDGFAIGCASKVGESLGERRRALAHAYARISQVLSFILGLGMITLIFIFREPVSHLFSDEEEVINGASGVLKFAVFVIIPQSLQWVTTGALRGAGDVKFTARTSMISVAIIRPLLSFLFCYPIGLGLFGSWLGMLIDQAIRFIVNNYRLTNLKWMDIRV